MAGGERLDGNISEWLPTSERALQELAPLSQALYAAFDYSIPVVNEFMKENTRRKETGKWLRPALIRYFVQNHLHARGMKTTIWDDDDHEPDIGIITLANNGIAGNYSGWEYRVVKQCSNGLPPPGPSRIKKAFYRQSHWYAHQPYLIPPPGVAEPRRTLPNILYLWEISGGGFVTLSLAIPRWGDETTASSYWTVSVPHPVTTYRPAEVHAEEIEEPLVTQKQEGIEAIIDAISMELREDNDLR